MTNTDEEQDVWQQLLIAKSDLLRYLSARRATQVAEGLPRYDRYFEIGMLSLALKDVLTEAAETDLDRADPYLDHTIVWLQSVRNRDATHASVN